MSLRTVAYLILVTVPLAAQTRDTSFTIWSAWQKIRTDHPEARPAWRRDPDGWIEHRDRVYATIGDRDLHMDVLVPAPSKGAVPCIVLIHGGGWRSGSKEQLLPLAQALVSRGFVVAAVEYRLSGEAKFPAAVHDLKAAVRWLRMNAQLYSVDTGRIAAAGGSAGGTLAALLGVTGNRPEWEGSIGVSGSSTEIRAVVDLDGIVDFTDPAESGKDTDPTKPSAGARWFGATYEQDPAVWVYASPLGYVTRKTPPTLFLNSMQKQFRAGRDSMMARMVRSDVHSEAHVFLTAPHTFWLFHPWIGEVVDRIDRFLQENM